MMHSPVGILTICLVGPVVEELCFREGVMGGLLRNGVKPWKAILVSAVLFGLIHFNPVQIVGAGLMGIILGIIYYKTGNIILATALHVLNNSVATLMALAFGMDATLTDGIGSAVVVSAAGLLT